MRKRSMLLIIAATLLITLGIALLLAGNQASAVVLPAKAQIEASMAALRDIYLGMENLPRDSYEVYLSNLAAPVYSGPELAFPTREMGGVYLSETNEAKAEIAVTAPQDGLYAIAFTYRPEGDRVLPTVLNATVDGIVPYEEWNSLQANNVWLSAGFPLDRYGNECVGMPSRSNVWQKSYFRTVSGRYSEPLLVYLKKGDHLIALSCAESAVTLSSLSLCPKPEMAKSSGESPDGNALLVLEAEQVIRRNNPNVRTGASYNSRLTPYSPGKKVQNYIEDSSFRYGGARVEYDFEAPADGYYNVMFHYRQADKAGFTVFRNIYIDGAIPNEGYQNVPFGFARQFTRYILPDAVFLTKGKHTLALEVSLDPTRYAIMILEKITDEMNDLTLEITRITGGNTDRYRDFNLAGYGIDAGSKLTYWAELLEKTHQALNELKSVSGKCGEIEQIQVAARLMRILNEKPNELPKRLNEFSRGIPTADAKAASNSNSISIMQYLVNTIESLQFSQLGLDSMILFQNAKDLPAEKTALAAMGDSIGHFFSSFGAEEYTPGYDGQSGETLQVWVSRPRQYLEIMQNLADTRFTPATGIKVDLSIVPDQAKLILANASGKAPDAAVAIASSGVYDLAIRGALANMRSFDTFKEVASRFAPGMLIPGVLDEGVYAIPETFNFWVMFYRLDILNSLGLQVPDTMQEVRDMLPQLRRMGMNFNCQVSNFIAKPFAATAPFIFQSGGNIYEDGTGLSALQTPEAIGALALLTENYTIYSMQYSISSFYQYFRDGRTPIGVSDYGTFNLLTNAAPELSGKWELAPYPGVADENGATQRWTSGAAESNVIFSSSSRKEEAWAFLDWWMSTEIQTDFSFLLQTTLGNEYMWNSANLQAIANAPWNRKHKAVILKQLEWTYETPRVPGGYMAEREISNAIDAVMKGTKLQMAIDAADRNINRELKRKLEEFGYTKDGVYVKPFLLPTIELVEGWLK